MKQENSRLKRLVGELQLEKVILTEVAGELLSPQSQRAAAHGAVDRYPRLSQKEGAPDAGCR